MPPIQTITREAVLEAGLELVRTEGFDALSARRLARAIGCSTQPIYSICGSMKELQEAIEDRIKQYVTERLAAEPHSNRPEFLQLGLALLRFAKDEPHLYARAAELMRSHLESDPPPPVIAAMRMEPRLARLPLARLKRVHASLVLVSQGLTSLLGPGSSRTALATAEQYLEEIGEAIVEHAARKGGR